jgi:glycogen debranching enzyme
MALEIKIGPPQLAIHQGYSVLVTEPDGQIRGQTDRGLYFCDTRLIAYWKVWASGEPWELLNGATLTHFAARVFLTNSRILTEDGEIPAHTLGLALSRSIGGGMHEDLDLTNHGTRPVRFNLEIAIRADFADIFEVRQGQIIRRGRIATEWTGQALRTTYRDRDFYRALTITPRASGCPALYANGRITFAIEVAPAAAWHSCVMYDLTEDDECIAAPPECIRDIDRSRAGRALTGWRQAVPRLDSSNSAFARLHTQAVDDLAALRLPVVTDDDAQYMPAGGLPWFIAPFGRDSLIVSLQAMLLEPNLARGALDVLGALQARERDDFRDAEPGKILHELRRGELAHFKLVPHTPYYGTADATPLYLILLHATWCRTGDRGLLERHLATAERCLEWIDHCGDRDGDGFQEYATRSPAGYENQGWKDAGDAVLYPDGTLVKGPKALCELQGYVYDAWRRMAEVFDELGQPDRAAGLRQKAAELFRRFNEAFWDEASGFYAYALDGDKRPVLTVVSNPGHCLWSGIVPPERAGRVIERLLQPDMCGGWGIRTLASSHPAFNPYSYQNGSVWPHDNGIIALGCKRYGRADVVARIAREIADAADFFMLRQLPELYAGIQREATNFPVQYMGANVPQAWAAGSVFCLVQALLGLSADARHGKLYVDPALPDWLPDLIVTGLKLGEQNFDLVFRHDGATTVVDVLDGDPAAIVRRRFESGFDQGAPAAGAATAATG